MRRLTSGRVDFWARGAGLAALVPLGWALFVPGGVFWTGVLAGGLICAAGAAAVLVHQRSSPTLAQLIGDVRMERVLVPALSGSRGGARLRPRGEQKA